MRFVANIIITIKVGNETVMMRNLITRNLITPQKLPIICMIYLLMIMSHEIDQSIELAVSSILFFLNLFSLGQIIILENTNELNRIDQGVYPAEHPVSFVPVTLGTASNIGEIQILVHHLAKYDGQ